MRLTFLGHAAARVASETDTWCDVLVPGETMDL